MGTSFSASATKTSSLVGRELLPDGALELAQELRVLARAFGRRPTVGEGRPALGFEHDLAALPGPPPQPHAGLEQCKLVRPGGEAAGPAVGRPAWRGRPPVRRPPPAGRDRRDPRHGRTRARRGDGRSRSAPREAAGHEARRRHPCHARRRPAEPRATPQRSPLAAEHRQGSSHIFARLDARFLPRKTAPAVGAKVPKPRPSVKERPP